MDKFRIERVWYVTARHIEEAIDASKGGTHAELRVTRMPERMHERAIIPSTGAIVCYRDGMPWPCTAAMAMGIEPDQTDDAPGPQG